MTELFISAFITLFVVIDPPGCAPIYAGLTKGATSGQRTSMAIRATLIASTPVHAIATTGPDVMNWISPA